MPDTEGNIVMPGGSISDSAVAAGRGARAYVAPQARTAREQRVFEEIAERMRDFEEALARDEERLGEAAGPVREQAAAVAEELARESPRKAVVLGLLKGISEPAQAAAGVLNAVHALVEAVHRLM